MANYTETSKERVKEIYEEIKDSLGVIQDGLADTMEGELAGKEMDHLEKNLDYLMNFAYAGAISNVDGLDKLLKSGEES